MNSSAAVYEELIGVPRGTCPGHSNPNPDGQCITGLVNVIVRVPYGPMYMGVRNKPAASAQCSQCGA